MNEGTVTGIVVGKWNFDGDTFMRLISRRRRGDPPNPDGKNFDAFTLRFNYFLVEALTEDLPQKGDVIRVRGYLQQTDDQVSMQELVKHNLATIKSAGVTVSDLRQRLPQVVFKRSRMEVVALAWETLSSQDKRKPRQQPSPKAAPVQAAAATAAS